MTDARDKKVADDIAALFRELREQAPPADPYLSTRVMARWRERKAPSSVSRIWKWVGVGASSLSAALAALLVIAYLRAPHFEAFVGKPFVVKMEVRDLGDVQIAKARIRLPDGVRFDLDGFPELQNQRELTLAWERRNQNEFIPFVLTAVDEGTKTITVDFFDASGRLVGSKQVAVRLKQKG